MLFPVLTCFKWYKTLIYINAIPLKAVMTVNETSLDKYNSLSLMFKVTFLWEDIATSISIPDHHSFHRLHAAKEMLPSHWIYRSYWSTTTSLSSRLLLFTLIPKLLLLLLIEIFLEICNQHHPIPNPYMPSEEKKMSSWAKFLYLVNTDILKTSKKNVCNKSVMSERCVLFPWFQFSFSNSYLSWSLFSQLSYFLLYLSWSFIHDNCFSLFSLSLIRSLYLSQSITFIAFIICLSSLYHTLFISISADLSFGQHAFFQLSFLLFYLSWSLSW